MKHNLTAGFLLFLGLPAMGIEAPGSSAPIPPQLPAGDARKTAEAPQPVPNAGPRAVPVNPAPYEDSSSNTGTLRQRFPEPESIPAPRPTPAPAPAAASAYLGIGGAEVPEILADHLRLSAGEGLIIRTLDPEGPAAKGGLSQNDIITRIDGAITGSQAELRQIVSGHKAGDEVNVDYIHKGEPKKLKLTLGEGRVGIARATSPMERLRLGGMPDDQARQIRDAVERNLRGFSDPNAGSSSGSASDLDPLDSMDQMQRGLQSRIQRMLGDNSRALELLGGMDMNTEPGKAGGGNGVTFKSTSSVQLLDEKGKIEMRAEDDSKTVRAFDREGKLQWEGPYNNDDDKKAMPEDVRERVEKLSPDMDFKGNGLRLHLGPRR